MAKGKSHAPPCRGLHAKGETCGRHKVEEEAQHIAYGVGHVDTTVYEVDHQQVYHILYGGGCSTHDTEAQDFSKTLAPLIF